MTRRNLIGGAGAFASFGAFGRSAAPAAGARRPNLLFLFTDQQRQDTLQVYGNSQIHVPNLNRLAASSVVFSKYYVSQPLCSPSRGTLLTGLYPHNHGATNNNLYLKASTPVLVEMLRKGEYATGYYGKWHLGNEVYKQHGFDEFESTEDQYEEYYTAKGAPKRSGYYEFLIKQGLKPDQNGEFSRKFANSLPKEQSKPAYLAHEAQAFLERHKSQPWVLFINFLDPHTPFTSVNDRMYDPKDMPVPSSFSVTPDAAELDRTKEIRDVILKGYKGYEGVMSSAQSLRENEARYWGKVSLVDEMVGRILSRLEQLGMADNTIILFSTDHGEMMGDHRLMFKSVMYEEASKVPMLLRIPWLKGSPPRVSVPVSQIDVVPTLLDLMGQPIPVHLQGKSWAPYLLNGIELPDRDVIIEWNGPPWPFTKEHTEPLRTIVTRDGWKMTLAEGGTGELFQLNSDPKEMRSVFYDQTSLPVIRTLAARINLWQNATGDREITFDETAWRRHRAHISQSR
jgi:arylsulfatase A-like enzyme